MLVLSRKISESIHIGHEIRVTLVSIQGNKVRLGIEAPGYVKVLRAELAELSSTANVSRNVPIAVES
jgi:carbon storage regulator